MYQKKAKKGKNDLVCDPARHKVSTLQFNQQLKFYYKVENKIIPKYFISSKMVIHQNDVHSHNTRGQLLFTPRICHTFTKNCLRHQLPGLLNDLAKNNLTKKITDKVSTHSEFGFSNYAKRYFLEKYKIECSIPNCRNNCHSQLST